MKIWYQCCDDKQYKIESLVKTLHWSSLTACAGVLPVTWDLPSLVTTVPSSLTTIREGMPEIPEQKIICLSWIAWQIFLTIFLLQIIGNSRIVFHSKPVTMRLLHVGLHVFWWSVRGYKHNLQRVESKIHKILMKIWYQCCDDKQYKIEARKKWKHCK